MKNIILTLFAILLLATCKKKDETPPASEPAPKFSVTYNGNGNTGGAVPVDGNSYDNGASATVLGNDGSLVRTGYSFLGWTQAADGSGTTLVPGAKLAVSSNMTLHARCGNNSSGTFFKVSYFGNGNTTGTAPVDNTFYVPGAQVIILGNPGGLAQNGNTFKSWCTSQSGNGPTFTGGSTLTIQGDLSLFALYNAGTPVSGKYIGFNASGQVKSKSSLSSSWSSEDLNNTFGSSSLVSAVWDGSDYVGFNASGQAKSKSSLSSSWSSEDLNNTFGSSSVVSVVWNGSKYVGFNASGQAKSKSSLTSSWSSEDLNNTFGSSSLVCVVWNGSKYVGFNASGQVKSKSSLSSSWSSEDLNNTFGSSTVVAAAWDGSRYVAVNASGQMKSKSSLSSSWSSEDLNNTFGSSSVQCILYK